MITATVEADSSLLLEPARELCFALEPARGLGAPGRAACHLTLSNVARDSSVVFKVRTRNPEVFGVRPTHGLIRPGTSVRVNISVTERSLDRLSRMRPKDLEARRSSDLFLIQSVELTADMQLAWSIDPQSTSSMRAFWKQVPREVVAENKLACRFLVVDPPREPSKTHSFMAADLTPPSPPRRASLDARSTFYGDCMSQIGEDDQTNGGRGDRQSFSSMRSAMSSSQLEPGNNQRRLSNASSSWMTAVCDSPTKSVASEGTAMFDYKSVRSTMVSNDTMLSTKSAATATTTKLLFSIHPQEMLKFEVKRAPRFWASSSFFIVNASQTDCLAFNVRTTNQDGYVVKPTRGLVSVTSAQKIEVQLCAPREGYMNTARREAKDAFLIEVASVSPEQYRELEALEKRDRARELSSLWSVLPPTERVSEMLTVELAVDPQDVEDICTPPRIPLNLTGITRSNNTTPGFAAGEDAARRRSTTQLGSRSGGGKPQAVMVVSADTMDMIDFSDPDVSFFV